MFQEGRDQAGAAVFQAVAEASGGAYHAFDQGSAKQLGELLGLLQRSRSAASWHSRSRARPRHGSCWDRSADHSPPRWHAMGGHYRRGAIKGQLGQIAPNRVRREGGISPRLVPVFYVLKRR